MSSTTLVPYSVLAKVYNLIVETPNVQCYKHNLGIDNPEGKSNSEGA